jgi:hypothetical protein
MSNQIQNPNVKMFSKTISYLSVNTQVVRFTVQGSGLFQFSLVNREPLNFEPDVVTYFLAFVI